MKKKKKKKHGYFLSKQSSKPLASMKRRDEHNPISLLQFVLFFPFEFPVCIVDQDKDPRSSTQVSLYTRSTHYHVSSRIRKKHSHVVLEYKQLLSLVLHHILNEILQQVGDIWRVAVT